MADRRVRQSGKDKDGDITSLCYHGESWSPRSKQGAISDIDGGIHRYYVREEGEAAWVKVIAGPRVEVSADSRRYNITQQPRQSAGLLIRPVSAVLS